MAHLLRVSLHGSMPSGEEWSVNPVWGLADFGEPVTQEQIQTVATAIANVAVPGLLLAAFTSTTTVNGARVEARQLDGDLEALAEATKATPATGTGVSAHPFQTSWVSSLRTAQVGATGRGRLYWPATGITVASTNLRPSQGNTQNMVDAVQSYLTGIQTAIRVTFPGAYLAVWSRRNSSLAAVNKIQCGDVLDVQRRRRDTLFETYFVASYPSP